jgi:hypothetical protein
MAFSPQPAANKLRAVLQLWQDSRRDASRKFASDEPRTRPLGRRTRAAQSAWLAGQNLRDPYRDAHATGGVA